MASAYSRYKRKVVKQKSKELYADNQAKATRKLLEEMSDEEVTQMFTDLLAELNLNNGELTNESIQTLQERLKEEDKGETDNE